MNIATLFNAMPGALAQGLIWAIMAIGVYLTFRILDVADLTVDGTLGLGGAVCIMCMISGMNVWLSLLLAFGAGLLAGLVTGLFHTFMGIPAILAGILTQLSLYSVNLKIMGKANQAINVDKYDLLVSLRYIKGVPFYRNTILIVAVLMVVVIAILYWFFGTELGCSIRATGCNANMARAQGINTNFNIVLGLMLSNGLVAFSGALLSQYQGFASGNSSLMIPACSSRGARSLVPEILVPTRPSKSSIPSATPYSVTEVPRTGMVLVPACAACRAGVALARIRSTLSETKPLMMVLQVLESPWAFFSSKVTASPSCSVRASLNPWVAASKATCCTSWQMPTL